MIAVSFHSVKYFLQSRRNKAIPGQGEGMSKADIFQQRLHFPKAKVQSLCAVAVGGQDHICSLLFSGYAKAVHGDRALCAVPGL